MSRLIKQILIEEYFILIAPARELIAIVSRKVSERFLILVDYIRNCTTISKRLDRHYYKYIRASILLLAAFRLLIMIMMMMIMMIMMIMIIMMIMMMIMMMMMIMVKTRRRSCSCSCCRLCSCCCYAEKILETKKNKRKKKRRTAEKTVTE
jgi:hypothetical protein